MHKALARRQDAWSELTVLQEEPGLRGRRRCRGWQAGAACRLQQDAQAGLAGCCHLRATLQTSAQHAAQRLRAAYGLSTAGKMTPRCEVHRIRPPCREHIGGYYVEAPHS